MKRYIYSGALLVLVAAIGVFALWPRSLPTLPVGSYGSDTEAWRSYFSTQAPEDAYAAFALAARALPYSEAHAFAHVIGEVLFEKSGEEGVTFCTPEYGYGCYHGVAGASFASRGMQAAVDLEGVCARLGSRDSFGCIHGIGHGILSFLGEEKLVEALGACTPIQGNNEYAGGCFGGVFMEYNYRTMQSESGISLRPFDAKRAYEPCATLPEQFQPACYYDQPSWWIASFGNSQNSGAAYARAGTLCDGAGAYKTVCYRGIGNVVGPNSGYDISLILTACSNLPSSGIAFCEREALAHLLQNEEGSQRLEAACLAGTIDDDICPEKSP